MSTIVTGSDQQLHRTIDWKGAFWVASGVPALVLFSIGGIGGIGGTAAFAIWAVSMFLGFVQSFTYAEIAGLFPNKSGGASVYGAAAWIKYGKFIAPLSVWCNWLAWTPVLSLGCAIAAGYILNGIAPIPGADSPAVVDWLANPANSAAIAGMTPEDAAAAAIGALTPTMQTWTLFSFEIEGFTTFSIGTPFFIGAVLMLIVFAIQHRGILNTARTQMIIGLVIVITMLIFGIVPLLQGKVVAANFSPMVPITGAWNLEGWTLVFGGLFIAAWSTYAFETSICYTREFKNPATDTFKAIFYSGLLCILIYILVPFTFQGVLGVAGMTDPAVVAGTGVAAAMAHMVGGGPALEGILVILMILALLLAIMTAMAGSSRTLYQGSVDGWLPRYLSHVNSHGAPTRAMWTDLCFNLILLTFAASDAGSYYHHPRPLKLRVHHLQLPQPAFRMDPSHGFRPCAASLSGADLHPRPRRHLRLPERVPDGSRGGGMGSGSGEGHRSPVGRPARSGADHSGLLVPALCAGRRQVPAADDGGSGA